MKHVTDLIGDDYKKWKAGESVFIDAPTGKGKTTFVLEKLLHEAKKVGKEVLFLSNRCILKEQLKTIVAKNQGFSGDEKWLKNVEDFDGITISTYQKFQVCCAHSGCFFNEEIRGRYKYVVFDEAHYIFSDALFNPEILLLLEFIRKSSAINVFLSGTMDDVTGFIKKWKYGEKMSWVSRCENEFLSKTEFWQYTSAIGVHYYVWEYVYPSEKRNLHVKYFSDFEELYPIINQDNSEKWLIFVSSKSRIQEYRKKINVSCDTLTANDKESEKGKRIISQICQKEKFSCKVLLTTSVLDNGINIKDSAVKKIVIETTSKTEFVQMLGRKRVLNAKESLTLYIPKKKLSFFSALLKLRIEPALGLFEMSKAEILSKAFNDPEIYKLARRFFCMKDGKLVENPTAKFHLLKQKEFCQKMIDGIKNDEWYFVKEQLQWVQLEEEFSENNSLTIKKQKEVLHEIEEFFYENANKIMNKNNQKIFCEKLLTLLECAKIIIVKKGRIPKKNSINKFLHDYELPYEIQSKKGNRRGEETQWIIKST